MTDLPSTAEVDEPRGSNDGSFMRPGSVDIGIPSFARSDEVGGVDVDLGTNSSSLRRFHIRENASFSNCLLSYYGARGEGLRVVAFFQVSLERVEGEA